MAFAELEDTDDGVNNETIVHLARMLDELRAAGALDTETLKFAEHLQAAETHYAAALESLFVPERLNVVVKFLNGDLVNSCGAVAPGGTQEEAEEGLMTLELMQKFFNFYDQLTEALHGCCARQHHDELLAMRDFSMLLGRASSRVSKLHNSADAISKDEQLESWVAMWEKHIEIQPRMNSVSFTLPSLKLFVETTRGNSIEKLIQDFVTTHVDIGDTKALSGNFVSQILSLKGSLPASLAQHLDDVKAYRRVHAAKQRLDQGTSPGLSELSSIMAESEHIAERHPVVATDVEKVRAQWSLALRKWCAGADANDFASLDEYFVGVAMDIENNKYCDCDIS